MSFCLLTVPKLSKSYFNSCPITCHIHLNLFSMILNTLQLFKMLSFIMTLSLPSSCYSTSMRTNFKDFSSRDVLTKTLLLQASTCFVSKEIQPVFPLRNKYWSIASKIPATTWLHRCLWKSGYKILVLRNPLSSHSRRDLWSSRVKFSKSNRFLIILFPENVRVVSS